MDPLVKPPMVYSFKDLIFNPGMALACWYSAVYFFRKENILFKETIWLPIRLGLPSALGEFKRKINPKGIVLIVTGYIALIGWIINL